MSGITIIPSKRKSDNDIHTTMGTRVLLDDGSELEGVISIKLEAEMNDVWKATIVCHPKEVVLTKALADQIIYKQHGIDNFHSYVDDDGKIGFQVELTNLADTSRRYDLAKVKSSHSVTIEQVYNELKKLSKRCTNED